MPQAADIAGQRFGRLVALVVEPTAQPGRFWRCACDCGAFVVSTVGRLRVGNTKSCGCLKVDAARVKGKSSATHGMFGTREYATWSAMLGRCSNPKHSAWPDYGGRGITVCTAWLKFDNFYADMGARPSGKSLDRVDNSGNYEPRNCRWATKKEQARNRRGNRLVEFNGTTATLAETAARVGLPVSTVRDRLNAGWPTEVALTKQSRKWRRKENTCLI